MKVEVIDKDIIKITGRSESSCLMTTDEAKSLFAQLARVDGMLPDYSQEVGAEYRRMLHAPNSVIPNYFDGAQFIINKIKGI